MKTTAWITSMSLSKFENSPDLIIQTWLMAAYFSSLPSLSPDIKFSTRGMIRMVCIAFDFCYMRDTM